MKKFFVNIILGFVPFSQKRKELRDKFLNCDKSNKKTAADIAQEKLCNNKFIVIDENLKETEKLFVNGLKVNFHGKNSKVIIHQPIKFSNCTFEIASNVTLEIQPSRYSINNLRITTSNNSTVAIGKNFSCFDCTIDNHDEAGKSVEIGEDCMFSHGIKIRTSDGHTIYDLTTKEILNKPKSGIRIGNHVWVGVDVVILKDVSIPSNCIIGAKSLVNKSFEEQNVVIAGTPAKIIKTNVGWDRNHTDKFKSGFYN